MNMTILTSTTGLLFMFVFNIISNGFYCFSIRNSWLNKVNFYSVSIF